MLARDHGAKRRAEHDAGRQPAGDDPVAPGTCSPGDVLGYLEGFHREVAAYLEERGRFRAGMATRHQRLALDHGIHAYESQLAWITDAIRILQQAHALSTGP